MNPDQEEIRYWQDLISSCRPGHSLEREFYAGQRVFERDVEQVFFKNWLFAGHASRIPNPGDYFIYQISGESVIVIRAKDRKVNALLNVCAHRGSRICREPSGHVGRLVCPYHGWGYDLDGSLVSARNMPAAFDQGAHGLQRVKVRVDEDLIHLCFAAQPPDFEPVAADIRKFFGPHGLTRAKIAMREERVIRANWKLVAENFSECYHCPPAHPELATVMSYVRAYDSPKLAEERRHYTMRWEAQARELGHVTGANKRHDGAHHCVSRIPIREGFLTQSKDGRPVAPLMGDFKAYDGGVTSIQFFPNSWYVADNDYAMLTRFTPLTVQETAAEITWLVHKNAREGTDYNIGDVTWLWGSTMQEDQEITETNQAGVNSRFYKPGPHSKDESLDEFYQWYLKQIHVQEPLVH